MDIQEKVITQTNVTKDDIIMVALMLANKIEEMDELGTEAEEAEYEEAYNDVQGMIHALYTMSIGKFLQDNPDTTLSPKEILHILACPSCKNKLAPSTLTKH